MNTLIKRIEKVRRIKDPKLNDEPITLTFIARSDDAFITELRKAKKINVPMKLFGRASSCNPRGDNWRAADSADGDKIKMNASVEQYEQELKYRLVPLLVAIGTKPMNWSGRFGVRLYRINENTSCYLCKLIARGFGFPLLKISNLIFQCLCSLQCSAILSLHRKQVARGIITGGHFHARTTR